MKFLILISLFFLSACGFTPVYGTNRTIDRGIEETFETIAIGNIPDREGQFLRNELIDRFYRNGRPDDVRFDLTFSTVTESQRNLDITIDSDTTRAQLTVRTTMQLHSRLTNEIVLERALQSTASYNVLGSEFANRVSEDATRENVLQDLARQVELQLSLYFKR